MSASDPKRTSAGQDPLLPPSGLLGFSSRNLRCPWGWLRAPARFHQGHCGFSSRVGSWRRGRNSRIEFFELVCLRPFRSGHSGRRKAIIEALASQGFVEGRNLVFEVRSGDGRYERLAELAAELKASAIDVIITFGYPAALAAKTSAKDVPVVVLGSRGSNPPPASRKGSRDLVAA